MAPDSLWHFEISASCTHNGFRLDGFSLFWKILEGEWIFGIHRSGDSVHELESPDLEWLDSDPPDDTTWRRVASVEDVPVLKILPVMPDRPVVVRPEFTYSLLPGEKVNIIVGVPLSVSIQTPTELTLIEEPVHPLSNTWFGLPTDGELCYAMRTLARREGENLDFGPARVICPVRIRNQSKEILSFERLCLRVHYLSIYENDHQKLWANESSVVIREKGSWSRVAFAKKAPANLTNPKLLSPGKAMADGTFLLRALNEGKGLFQ